MSDSPKDPGGESSGQEPVPYRLECSGQVINELHNLLLRAEHCGVGPYFRAAAREIDRRLRLYPQFGQPLMNATQEPMQIWLGVVEPLVVRDIIDETRRLVIVAVPFGPTPGSLPAELPSG